MTIKPGTLCRKILFDTVSVMPSHGIVTPGVVAKLSRHPKIENGEIATEDEILMYLDSKLETIASMSGESIKRWRHSFLNLNGQKREYAAYMPIDKIVKECKEGLLCQKQKI
jgi:hypothetical protein